MANKDSGLSCGAGCWLMAAAAGVVALIMLLAVGDFGYLAALFLSAVLVVGLGPLFSFLFCRDLPPLNQAPEERKAPAAPSATERAPAAAPEPEPEARSAVSTGTQLPGEQELAERKGEWTYDGQEAGAPAPDGPGAVGARPEGLAQARDGQPDDLKQIKGIGPKLERLLQSMGYFHYDQIAAWGPEEVAWVDENLEGFKGRVSRDDWVNQAKALAADRDGNTQ
jgi:predicted flap endonuclease-1-like 5' DNA nuclease